MAEAGRAMMMTKKKSSGKMKIASEKTSRNHFEVVPNFSLLLSLSTPPVVVVL